MKNGKPLPEIPGPPISHFNYRSRDEKFMRTHWCFMTALRCESIYNPRFRGTLRRTVSVFLNVHGFSLLTR